MAFALPALLAGPQLRRVTPKGASVWMAFSAPATVTLKLYEGPVFASAPGTSFATGKPAETIPIATKLHVVVAQVDAVLAPGKRYAYDVSIGMGGQKLDLRSLGLLATKQPDGGEADLHYAQLPLGHVDGRLPGFVAAPDVPALHLLHGSCRKTTAPGEDALAVADDRIAIVDQARPHLLLLTGDQIYADDVAMPLLPWLSAVGAQLVGGADAPSQLILTKEPNGPETFVPIDLTGFPAGLRAKWLIEEVFTSTEGPNHLIAFGEYAAMYLFAWSPWLWWSIDAPATLAAFVARYPNSKSYTEKDVYDQHRKALVAYARGVPRVARALANVPTLMICDDHEVTDDWNRTRTWRNRAYGTGRLCATARALTRNGIAAYQVFQDLGNEPAAYYPAAGTTPKLDALLKVVEHLPAKDAAWRDTGRALDKMYGIGPSPALGADPKPGDSQVTWDLAIIGAGPGHDVFLLDTRTRRRYVRDDDPPVLLDRAELQRQIPSPAAGAADRLAIVVSGGNVVTEGAMREVQTGIVRAVETDDELDREGWDEHSCALAMLFERLAERSRVILLSGDVHHSFTVAIDYYAKARNGQPARARRIPQLVGSAFKNWDLGVSILLQTVLKKGAMKADPVRLGYSWFRTPGTTNIELAHLFATRGGADGAEIFDANDRGAVVALPSAALAKRWPDVLVKPDQHWVSIQLPKNAVAALADPNARQRMVEMGFSPMFYWRNNIGDVTFTHDGQGVIYAVYGEDHSARNRFEVGFSPEPDPLGAVP